MKKLLALSLAFLLMAGSVCFGSGGTGLVPTNGVFVSTVIVDRSATTNDGPVADIVSEISTSDEILGYSITATSSGPAHGAVAALWDDTSATTSRQLAPFDELEVGETQISLARWFPYRLKVTRGLVVGTENECIVTIYYIDN